MRICWRNLELPVRVEKKEVSSDPNYSEFIIEPFAKGLGETIGNSLRRILLSAIEGCAVTSIKIEDEKREIIQHEFCSIPGVYEDVTEIIVNIKKLRFKMDVAAKDPVKLYIDVKKKGEITGADIEENDKVQVVNKDSLIATLTKKKEFLMELVINRGRGYRTAEENENHFQKNNTSEPQKKAIFVDSIFSPVQHVKYWIDDTRVGKITNYDRLIMGITTDGSITPEIALVESAKILKKHLNPFTQYFELGSEIKKEPTELIEEKEEEKENLLSALDRPVTSLNLKVRAANCLSSVGIYTIKDLVSRSEQELLNIRSLGKTTLNEIKDELRQMDLYLGMNITK